jgi:hypothetical protein
MKHALLALEALLLVGALIALWMNALAIATALGFGAGLVVVAEKWRQ